MTRFDDSTPEDVLVTACADVQSDSFESAFEELYRRYRDRVYSIAYRMTGRSVDAMDVVQDSFRVLFLKIGSFRFDSRFSTWLFRIVVNCSIDHQRRNRAATRRLGQSLTTIDGSLEPIDEAVDPTASAQSTELGEHVHRALGRLSPKLRAVLVLRYLEGLSYEQLAETLQIQLGTVKSRLARAHVALEKILEGTLEAFGYAGSRAIAADEEGDVDPSDDAATDATHAEDSRREVPGQRTTPAANASKRLANGGGAA